MNRIPLKITADGSAGLTTIQNWIVERVWDTSQQAASYGSGNPLPLLANWKGGHISIACK